MRFFARLDPNSAIHRQWREGTRISGLLEGVLFRWSIKKLVYEAGEIPAEIVDRFRLRADKAVQLEAIGVLPEPLQQVTGDSSEPEKAKPKSAGIKRLRLSE